jgi:hypothetical protein
VTEIKMAIPVAFTAVIPANFPALESFTSFHEPAIYLPLCACLPVTLFVITANHLTEKLAT